MPSALPSSSYSSEMPGASSQIFARFRTHKSFMYSRPAASKHDGRSSTSSSVKSQEPIHLTRSEAPMRDGWVMSRSACGAAAFFHRRSVKNCGNDYPPCCANFLNRPEFGVKTALGGRDVSMKKLLKSSERACLNEFVPTPT